MTTSWIVIARWTEPCPGLDAKVARLDEEGAKKALAAVDWLAEQAAAEWGETIPSVELHPTAAEGGDILTFQGLMHHIAATCRYCSGEGIYEEDCPELEALAIKRD